VPHNGIAIQINKYHHPFLSYAGPNGKGKTTLLKLMARRQIPVPDTIDVLLVEQEVAGSDDQTALAAVVAADQELMELR
jgi:ATP-binding cassette subfamily F protein 1